MTSQLGAEGSGTLAVFHCVICPQLYLAVQCNRIVYLRLGQGLPRIIHVSGNYEQLINVIFHKLTKTNQLDSSFNILIKLNQNY